MLSKLARSRADNGGQKSDVVVLGKLSLSQRCLLGDASAILSWQ